MNIKVWNIVFAVMAIAGLLIQLYMDGSEGPGNKYGTIIVLIALMGSVILHLYERRKRKEQA